MAPETFSHQKPGPDGRLCETSEAYWEPLLDFLVADGERIQETHGCGAAFSEDFGV
jgi:hypothetical protein